MHTPNSKDSQEPAKGRKPIRIISIIAAVLLAGGFFGLLAAGVFANHTTAVTVGGYKLSPAQFSYFYWDAFYDYFNANQGDISQVEEARNTVKTAMYNEEQGITMTEHFTEVALQDASTVYSVYAAAQESGYQLTEADQDYLKKQRSMLDVYVYSLGLSDAEEYVRQFYGRDCTLDGYLEYLQLRKAASGYADSTKASFTYTPDQLDAAYAASPRDFESVSYKVYYVSAQDADLALAQQQAQSMAEQSRGDVDRFNELTVELAPEQKKGTYTDPDFSLRTEDTASQATEPLRDWLCDPARQYGDTTYVQADEQGYFVCFFIRYHDNDFALPNIRVVQVAATADGPDGAEQAAATGQAILDAYAVGPQTADGFWQAAQTVRESDESVSTSIQSPLLPSGTPADVRDWCFDSARKAGDTLLQPASGGCYVLYFEGYADRTYRDHLAENALREADYNAWYEGVSTAHEAVSHSFGMLFVRK